ncbi:hypothetical protein Ae201684P_018938 [Aphanomyces euteiches]|uniref:Uncharacterized protein n=1 Tax=Aphanomyces euteiches TaxID=100861 RepID=A0A6G0WES3_9STRA|nr:hypothetical protein Ae201684_015790 [Aphanomyces euteiches]KAH9099932.1 hypothetical protein Ae201684P_018938 [Aphanomyces euteiches]
MSSALTNYGDIPSRAAIDYQAEDMDYCDAASARPPTWLPNGRLVVLILRPRVDPLAVLTVRDHPLSTTFPLNMLLRCRCSSKKITNYRISRRSAPSKTILIWVQNSEQDH